MANEVANHVAQFDTRIEIVTPENIAFQYRVAGPFRRLPAYLVDLTVRGILAVVGMIGFSAVLGIVGMADLGMGLTLVLWFALAWFYGGMFEAYWNGQTPGKRIMQIRVVTVDGQPINGLQAVLRNVLRTIDAQPGMTYLAGLVATTMNDRFQRLGDLACGTMVVVEQPHWFRGVERTGGTEVAELVGRIPAGFQASPSLSRALAGYVQRRRNFSLARRLEIARHLGVPLQEQFGLPADTNPDLLLCALYHRTFITDRQDESSRGSSPFMNSPRPRADSDMAVEAILLDNEPKEVEAPIIRT